MIDRTLFKALAVFSFCALFFTPSAVRAEGTCISQGQWMEPTSGRILPYGGVMADMARRPVVLLGETHTSAENHRWQLQVLSALYGRNANMVLGFESFPRSVQPVLDRWTRGELSEKKFLKDSRWDDVWTFDPNLYMPLFHFARMHRIPMIALNVERDLVSKVRKKGWKEIPGKDREGVTDPVPAPTAYLDELAEIFALHAKMPGRKTKDNDEPKPIKRDDPAFLKFVDAQLLWDRAMAEKLAAARLGGGDPLVIGIVGSGHLEYGYGITRQLADLGVAKAAVLLPWPVNRPCSDLVSKNGAAVADAVFGIKEPKREPEPEKPKLGVIINDAPGGIRIGRVAPGSVAMAAGLKKGDVIFKAAGVETKKTANLIAIIKKQAPGTWLPLAVKRDAKSLDIVARFPPGKAP